MSVILLIIGLVMFVGLVILHELGHFIVARRNGVEVEEFGLGFPPRAKILGKKNGTIYSLNWLPLGGFVKLKGEHDADTEKGTFGAASLWAKTKIMLAGVFVNLITAYVLLIVLALVGVPKLIDNQFTVASDQITIRNDILVGLVEADSPAQKAGMQVQDKLRSIGPINGQQRDISNPEAFPQQTKSLAGKDVTISYERDGKLIRANTQLRSMSDVEASKKTANPKGYLGIAPINYEMNRYTWSSPIVAAGLIKQFTELTFKGLGTAIAGLAQGDTKKATEQVSGPVGIFVILRDGTLLGFQFILMIIAVISLTLAIMNVLPIPALDGGRLFLTLFFRIIRKPLTHKIEEIVVGSSFALLMVLFVLITIVDVKRFF